MQSRTRGIRIHIENIHLWLRAAIFCAKRFVIVPILLPLWLYCLKRISHGFDCELRILNFELILVSDALLPVSS